MNLQKKSSSSDFFFFFFAFNAKITIVFNGVLSYNKMNDYVLIEKSSKIYIGGCL
jgi:hypothetical protein